MAKLPVKVKAELVNVQENQIPYLHNVIERRKNNDPSLPEHFYEKDASYYEGLLGGAYTMIETLLHAYNNYNGFSEHRGYRVYTIR